MKKEVLDLFMGLYSMPQWATLPKEKMDKQKGIENFHLKLVNLHKLIEQLDANESKKINAPAPNKFNLFTYGKIMQLMKDFLISRLLIIYGNKTSFEIVGDFFTQYKEHYTVVEEQKLKEKCGQLSDDISRKTIENKRKEQQIEIITSLLKSRGIENPDITENNSRGANDGYVAISEFQNKKN